MSRKTGDRAHTRPSLRPSEGYSMMETMEEAFGWLWIRKIR
jgi:hypothetical protein